MQDFPISTHITTDGTFVIRQPLTLDDPQDYIEIEMSDEQAARLIKEIKVHLQTLKPVVKKASVVSERFEEFWSAYPSHRRFDKRKCLLRWEKQNLDAVADTIINHVIKMAASDDWTKEQGKYCPLVTTYLNQSRWEAAETVQRAWTMPSV